jgi:hypothetical protein
MSNYEPEVDRAARRRHTPNMMSQFDKKTMKFFICAKVTMKFFKCAINALQSVLHDCELLKFFGVFQFMAEANRRCRQPGSNSERI